MATDVLLVGDASLAHAVRGLVSPTWDFTSAGATAPMVWTTQLPRGLHHFHPDGLAVVLLEEAEFDGEITLWRLQRQLPPGWRILALAHPLNAESSIEGYEHEVSAQCEVVRLATGAPGEILMEVVRALGALPPPLPRRRRGRREGR